MNQNNLISKLIRASNHIYNNSIVGNANYIFIQDSDTDESLILKDKDVIFVAKYDSYFEEGYQSELIDLKFITGEKFNFNRGVFRGVQSSKSIKEEWIPIKYVEYDNGVCEIEAPFREFEIYDKFGNEISELSLLEYKQILRDMKINKLLD